MSLEFKLGEIVCMDHLKQYFIFIFSEVSADSEEDIENIKAPPKNSIHYL